MMKSSLGRSTLLLLVGLNLLGCGRQAPAWKARITKESGVIVVRNPSTPRYRGPIMTLEEELSIGQASGRDEDMFSRINGMDVDHAGRIYAIEGVEASIRVYDKDGHSLRTIGRKGQGPGEFQMPLFIQVTAAGEICVGDYSGARMIYISAAGESIRQTPMPRPFLPIGRDPHGNLLGMEVLAPPPRGGKALKTYDADLKLLAVIAGEEPGEREVFDIGKPSCFGALTADGHIVWGDSKEYIIHESDTTGRPIRRIINESASQGIGAADRRRFEEQYAEPLKAGMKLRFRDHYPAFSDILTDDEGRIFVKTYERVEREGSRFYFDVFQSDGIYIAKLDIPASLDRRSVWKRGKLYTVETSPEGYPLIKRYRVRWRD